MILTLVVSINTLMLLLLWCWAKQNNVVFMD